MKMPTKYTREEFLKAINPKFEFLPNEKQMVLKYMVGVYHILNDLAQMPNFKVFYPQALRQLVTEYAAPTTSVADDKDMGVIPVLTLDNYAGIWNH